MVINMKATRYHNPVIEGINKFLRVMSQNDHHENAQRVDQTCDEKKAFNKIARVRVDIEIDVHPDLSQEELQEAILENSVFYSLIPGYARIFLKKVEGEEEEEEGIIEEREDEYEVDLISAEVIGYRNPRDDKEAKWMVRTPGCGPEDE